MKLDAGRALGAILESSSVETPFYGNTSEGVMVELLFRIFGICK